MSVPPKAPRSFPLSPAAAAPWMRLLSAEAGARWRHPVGSRQPRSPQLQHHLQVVFYTHIKCQALAKSQMKYNATAVAQCP